MNIREIQRIDIYIVDAATGECADEPAASVRVREGQELALQVFYDEEIE